VHDLERRRCTIVIDHRVPPQPKIHFLNMAESNVPSLEILFNPTFLEDEK
jgi:hypothetical protein